MIDPDVPGDSLVEVCFRDGDTAFGLIHDWDQNWQWACSEEGMKAPGAIIAWRPHHSTQKSNEPTEDMLLADHVSETNGLATVHTYQVNKIVRRYRPDVPVAKHCLRPGEDRMLVEEISALRAMLIDNPTTQTNAQGDLYLVSALVESTDQLGHRAQVARFTSKEEAIGASLELWRTDGWSVKSINCANCDKHMGGHVTSPKVDGTG